MAPSGKQCKAPSFSISRCFTAGGSRYGPKKSYSIQSVLYEKAKDCTRQRSQATTAQSTPPIFISGPDDLDGESEDIPVGSPMDYINAIIDGHERVDLSHSGGEAELLAETLQKALYML